MKNHNQKLQEKYRTSGKMQEGLHSHKDDDKIKIYNEYTLFVMNLNNHYLCLLN